MIDRFRVFFAWCAYRSPWGRAINWLAHLMVHGETPMQAVCRDRDLTDHLGRGQAGAARIRAELVHLERKQR